MQAITIPLGIILTLVAVFYAAAAAAAADANDIGNNELPIIWPAIGDHKQYHVMFQVLVSQSNERYTIEEWASFDEGLHRLDLIKGEERTTYLTNGKTKEVFMYKPYSCTRLEKTMTDEGQKTMGALFRGYPMDTKSPSDSVIAYGLGPLWLSAKAQAKKVSRMPLRVANPLYGRFEFYNITFGNDATDNNNNNNNFNYNLIFAFAKDFKFVDSVEWVVSSVGASGSIQHLAEMKVKVVQMPGKEPIPSSVFDIPVGYGCIRGPGFDRPLNIKAGMQFFQQDGSPSQALLEVKMSQPRDSTHLSWLTQRHNVRLLRNEMKFNNLVHSHYVSRVQSRDPLSDKIMHRRKVWSDLRASDDESSSFTVRNAAILYTIDEETDSCQVAHVDESERLRIDLPTWDDRLTPPIRISLDVLDCLFNDWFGFHLIHDQASSLSEIAREAIYEKRMNELRLCGSGVIVWPGPVSIIKEVSLLPQYESYPFAASLQQATLFESYRIKVSLLFYSDDLTQVKFKMGFDLFESKTVDFNYMQQQLNIATCIDDDRKEELVVKYPIESDEMRGSMIAMQDLIGELFCIDLFRSTPIQPLQVDNLEITFDDFSMFVRLELLDLPLWQIYQKRAALMLDAGAARFEKVAPSIESCAKACEHHSCLRFAFDQSKQKCQLELGAETSTLQTKSSQTSVLFEAPSPKMRSPWTELDRSLGRKHLRPQEMLEVLRQFIGFDSTNSAESIVPLTIRIDQAFLAGKPAADSWPPAAHYVELKPESLESSLDSMSEFSRISATSSNGDSTAAGNNDLVVIENRAKLRAEYWILLEDRDFMISEGGVQRLAASSYEECARSCDDTNCRSFSYCENSRDCSLTQFHDSSQLQKRTKHALACSVSVLDFLSKFEAFGAAPMPIKAKKVLTSAESARDCAHACLMDDTISCQAFYFCQKIAGLRSDAEAAGQLNQCYLEDKHIYDINPNGLKGIEAYQLATAGVTRAQSSSKLPFQAATVACSFYSRSYLAQFDQYTGKVLAAAAAASGRLIENSGPDACARSCIESSCLVFDVCLTPDARQICHLGRGSVRKADLSASTNCSTFVLSDRSQFKLDNSTIVDLNRPDREALSKLSSRLDEIVVDESQREAAASDITGAFMSLLEGVSRNQLADGQQLVGGSHWLSRLVSVVFGLMLGVCCALAWTKAREPIQLAGSRIMAIFGR